MKDLLHDLIVIDPPWPLRKTGTRISRPNQGTVLDYPVMSLESIKNFQFASCDNSWLFLWTPQKFLPYSFHIVKEWGFKYVLTLTWDKANGICLMGFHWRTEFCLVGYKGISETFRKGKAIPTIFKAKSMRHSAKPDEFYKMIEPLGKERIDIFARKQRKGWDTWGNEIPSNKDSLV